MWAQPATITHWPILQVPGRCVRASSASNVWAMWSRCMGHPVRAEPFTESALVAWANIPWTCHGIHTDNSKSDIATTHWNGRILLKPCWSLCLPMLYNFKHLHCPPSFQQIWSLPLARTSSIGLPACRHKLDDPLYLPTDCPILFAANSPAGAETTAKQIASQFWPESALHPTSLDGLLLAANWLGKLQHDKYTTGNISKAWETYTHPSRSWFRLM